MASSSNVNPNTCPQDLNKSIQKVKEAINRVNKNNIDICFVNLESLQYNDLCKVADASLTFKSGKDKYMCSDKIICMVSYEESDNFDDSDDGCPSREDPSLQALDSHPKGQMTKNRINIAMNITDKFYERSWNGGPFILTGHGASGKSIAPFCNMDGTEPPNIDKIRNLFILLSNGRRPVNSGGNGQELWHCSYVEEQPFKAVDAVMQQFYALMRATGFLIDEEDDEPDMGALADAVGIEW